MSGRGGVNPPPFFRIGLLLLSEDGWGSEKAFDPFGDGGFSPSRRKAAEDENSSSNALALTIFSFLAPPHPKSNRIDRRDDVSSS